ncbi:hypothetical protein [Pseudoxanthomonas suwonensis]|nr:hypothetical protein [Pseudoxanthomonas suwonensis]
MNDKSQAAEASQWANLEKRTGWSRSESIAEANAAGVEAWHRHACDAA